jgi:hypothetical protein
LLGLLATSRYRLPLAILCYFTSDSKKAIV